MSNQEMPSRSSTTVAASKAQVKTNQDNAINRIMSENPIKITTNPISLSPQQAKNFNPVQNNSEFNVPHNIQVNSFFGANEMANLSQARESLVHLDEKPPIKPKQQENKIVKQLKQQVTLLQQELAQRDKALSIYEKQMSDWKQELHKLRLKNAELRNTNAKFVTAVSTLK